jgi:hypothetical protein
MSTLCHSAESTKNYASAVDAIPFVPFQIIASHRNPKTGRIDGLKALLKDYSGDNPREKYDRDFTTWTPEQRMTHVFDCLKSVANKDLGDETECLWNSAYEFLFDLIMTEPAGSDLFETAQSLYRDLYSKFSISNDVKIADRDWYATNALKAIGLDVPVHFVDGDISFFSISDLLNALQIRLMEAGFPFQIWQNDAEWAHIEDCSVSYSDDEISLPVRV